MASLNIGLANDIARGVLIWYARGPALSQTTQDKPLLRVLTAGAKTFSGGNQYVSDPVQGAYMSDASNTAILNGGAFFQGYTADDKLSFSMAQNLLRAEARWYECHAGFVITWTELKVDGITVVDDNQKTEHGDMALTRLTGLLENRMDDFAESWARSKNAMLWNDGAQDPKQIPGITALLTTDPNNGVTMGLSRATYPWWRHGVSLDIVPSAENQTLARTLRSKQRVVRKRGGKPGVLLCGSRFADALELEYQAKGEYTMTGFASSGQNDIGMEVISMRGVGKFEYDPTLDDMNLATFCFEIDASKLRYRPMVGEENKVTDPARPYEYFIFLKSMTLAAALQMTQANAHYIFSVANEF